MIDARIHDTVNTRPCNNWRCYKQRGGIGLAKADEVQTHHELGRVCSSALVEIFFFKLFLRWEKTGDTLIPRCLSHTFKTARHNKANLTRR